MKRTLINPPGTEGTYETWKFSQAVKVGDTIWVSGQVGFGPDGVPEDFTDQAKLVFENLKRVLEHAGASLADVVETTTYLTDMNDRSDFAPVRDEYFVRNFPASTMLGISALAMPQLKVEVHAIAVIGSAEIE
jgi:reactive intermediate/imine deaminase